jgi:hypothetical protein
MHIHTACCFLFLTPTTHSVVTIIPHLHDNLSFSLSLSPLQIYYCTRHSPPPPLNQPTHPSTHRGLVGWLKQASNQSSTPAILLGVHVLLGFNCPLRLCPREAHPQRAARVGECPVHHAHRLLPCSFFWIGVFVYLYVCACACVYVFFCEVDITRVCVFLFAGLIYGAWRTHGLLFFPYSYSMIQHTDKKHLPPPPPKKEPTHE